jgi:hypothetical protein
MGMRNVFAVAWIVVFAVACTEGGTATTSTPARSVEVTAGVNGHLVVGLPIEVSMDLHNSGTSPLRAILSISPAWSQNHAAMSSADCQLAATRWDCGLVNPGEWRVARVSGVELFTGTYPYEVRSGPTDYASWIEAVN